MGYLRWAGVVGLWLTSIAGAEAATQQTLVIFVLDYAGVTRAALTDAAGDARRIFAHAGVETEWRICSQRVMDTCELPHDAVSPILRIIPKGGAAGAAFGAAIKSLDRGFAGIYATIFYSRIANASRTNTVDVSALLSSVFAHELGELLGLEHSSDGIMQPAFDAADMERAARGRLQFSEAEAAFLRNAVSGRVREAGITAERQDRPGGVSHLPLH